MDNNIYLRPYLLNRIIKIVVDRVVLMLILPHNKNRLPVGDVDNDDIDGEGVWQRDHVNRQKKDSILRRCYTVARGDDDDDDDDDDDVRRERKPGGVT